MNKLTNIRQRLIISYAILLVFLLAISLVALQRFDQLALNMREVVEGDAARAELASAINLHAETAASRLLLLFVLDEREQRVATYKEIDQENAKIDQAIVSLGLLTDDAAGQQTLARLNSLRKTFAGHFMATVEELEVGERARAVQQMTGPTRAALNAFLAQTAGMAQSEQISMRTRQAHAVQSSERSIQLVLVLGFGALLAGLLMAIYIIRGIVSPLRQAVTAADQIADGNLGQPVPSGNNDEIGKLLASMSNMCGRLRTVVSAILQSASSVSVAVEQLRDPAAKVKADSAAQSQLAGAVDRSIVQLSQGIGAMAESVLITRDQAIKARDLAHEGASAISVVSSEIAQIANVVAVSAQSVTLLDRSAKEVAGAVSQIRDIASQTNLLALNASIEAARAGESGRGFAVVADEVRTLANRTAEVTTHIDRVITLINEQTQSAVKDIDAGKRGMEHGVGLIQSIAVPLEALQVDAQVSLDNLEKLTGLAAGQARESEVIASNVREILGMANTNRQATDQLAVITGQLLETANGLQRSVTAFRL